MVPNPRLINGGQSLFLVVAKLDFLFYVTKLYAKFFSYRSRLYKCVTHSHVREMLQTMLTYDTTSIELRLEIGIG